MSTLILEIVIFTMCAICIILLTMGYIWRFSRRFTNWAYGSTNDLLVGSATLAWAAFYFMGVFAILWWCAFLWGQVIKP